MALRDIDNVNPIITYYAKNIRYITIDNAEYQEITVNETAEFVGINYNSAKLRVDNSPQEDRFSNYDTATTTYRESTSWSLSEENRITRSYKVIRYYEGIILSLR